MLHHWTVLLAAVRLIPCPGLTPAAFASAAGPCTFGHGSPIPESSTWSTQFKCYQSSGRRVRSGSFEAGTVSGGACITGTTQDRFQVAASGSFGGDAAMTVAYSAIAYLVDDPRADVANFNLSPLFHR